MLCKKCKTSVPDGAKKCSYCGAPISDGKRSRQALMAALAVAAVAGTAYLFLSLSGRLSFETEVGETPPPLFTEKAETPIPTKNPDSLHESETEESSESAEEREPVYIRLAEVAAKVRQFVNSSGDEFISMGGYLYNYTKGEYVSGEVFISDSPGQETEPPEDYGHILLLYVMPHDFLSINEADLSGDGSRDLRIYAAAEVSGGVAAADSGRLYGLIYRENFNGVINLYENRSGQAFRLPPHVYPYDTFLELAAAYTYSSGGFTARYICIDDKYAFAVLTELGEPERLKAFIFERVNYGNDGGGSNWTIVMSDLEEYDNLVTAINQILPDFNLEMLPGFSLQSSDFMDEATIAALSDLVTAEGLAGLNSEAEFISGCGNLDKGFAYTKLISGEKLLLYSGGGRIWEAFAVSGWEEAESLLDNLSYPNVSYIIRQE